MTDFQVAETTDGKGVLIGVSGLEIYSDMALLRSVAVYEDLRGKEIGSQLITRTLEQAKKRKIRSVYLLTETAKGYFHRFGFKEI